MKEADLIKCLTEFLTQNKFSDCIKTFDISKNYGDLKFNVVFDINKLNKIETKEEYQNQGHVEVKVPEKKIETPELSDSSYEDDKEPELDYSETEIAYSASAGAIDEANEKFLAEIDSDGTARVVDLSEHTELDEKIEKEKQQKKPKSFLDDLDMKAVEAAQNQPVISKPSKEKTKQLTSQKTTLYKNKVYTDDEVTIINSYLQRECTGPEAAEMLGITVKAFYSLTQRYKRASNIKSGRASAEDKIKANRTESKLTLADLDQIYSQIKRGDTLSNCAKDYKVANSTLSIRLNKYIKANGLEPLFVNSKNININKQSSNVKKKKATIVVPKGTTDGWHMLDNQFHLVKDGVVIE